MKFSNRILGTAAVLMLAASMTSAQTPGTPHAGPGGHMKMLAAALDLTDAQKSQAQAISDAERAAAQPLHDQLKAGEPDIQAAVKANDQAKIASLVNAQTSLRTQLDILRLQSQAKIYALLTPAQQAKLDTLHGLGGPGFGRGHGPQ